MVNALSEIDVPAVISVRKDEFQTPPFQWLHAALRLANSRLDREQLRRVRKSFYEIEGVEVDVPLPATDSREFAEDLLLAWVHRVLAHPALESYARDFLTGIAPIISGEFDADRFIRDSLGWFPSALIRANVVAREGFEDYPEELKTWQDLVQSIRTKYTGDVTLPILLQEFDLCSKTPPVPPDAVRCFTVHAAKGMEFDHVYVCGLAEEVFPSWQSVKDGYESPAMREERRNCFVAITRTQTSLTLTYALRYRGWKKDSSRFLAQMGLQT